MGENPHRAASWLIDAPVLNKQTKKQAKFRDLVIKLWTLEEKG